MGKVGEEFWDANLPEWLLDKFSPERTREEKMAWLTQWRRASLEVQARMVAEQGWELMQWAYWFGDENEEWVLWSVEADAMNHLLKIRLKGADEQSPVSAVKWLVEQSGCHVSGMTVFQE